MGMETKLGKLEGNFHSCILKTLLAENERVQMKQDLLTLSDRVVNVTMVVDAMEEDLEAIQATGGGEPKALKLVDITMTVFFVLILIFIGLFEERKDTRSFKKY